MLRVLACLSLVSVAACVFSGSNPIAEEDRGAPGIRRILLAPPNLVLALRPEIQQRSGLVDRDVVAYLESQGREVERFGLIEGRRLWKEAVAEAKDAEAIERGAELFVAKLAAEHDFDALVMPSLLVFQKQMDAGNASWDGVSRRMKMLNAPRATERSQNALASGIAYGGISGPAWVTSLHVLVFTRDGRRVFEGRGGIEFLQQINFLGGGGGIRFEMSPNTSIFRDPDLLREGVVRAFDPFLIPPDA